MKSTIISFPLLAGLLTGAGHAEEARHLFMDVHELDAVTADAVADAHAKDLAVQNEFGVDFKRYWVDEANAKVYCLAEADDAGSISAAHAKAHGLVPQNVYQVDAGMEEPAAGDANLFMDVHKMGAGKVTPEDVAAAHELDLAVQSEHEVHFINYWVDDRTGDIFCLSEAASADDVIATHRDAHGLISDEIARVAQGE